MPHVNPSAEPEQIAEYERLLTACREGIERAEAELRFEQEARDGIIARASELGLPRRLVAEKVGLSPGRVQQIVDAYDWRLDDDPAFAHKRP